ncbi:hypothetical protein [Streptomyces sp. NBC_00503]|uniref:hypothetical protein n=1 Tax=Streptomyces sp. NBC_00503 TaxID=2903659 RepID=UPI002E8024AA|nr:hypothetical protein [Streptomyces sp. NBC_00503]WUD81822.1 hypothetical protein OG490_15475 [Streptomyces sp. NBC_00503]
MPSIRRSIRKFRRARNDAFVARVRFCDGCAEVSDPVSRSDDFRRAHDSVLALHGARI